MPRITSTGRSSRPPMHSNGAPGSSKKVKKSKGGSKKPSKNDESPSLDIYSYTSATKRPRGDVDPESRASYGSRSNKGKGRQNDDEDEDLEEGEGEEEEEDSFRNRGDSIVEFNGIKPAGLYMGGGDDDDDEMMRSDDDEEIDSDELLEEDDLPKKGVDKKSKKQMRRPEIDLDEEEIDYEDEEGAGFMNASEMLDAGDYDSSSEEEEEDDEASDRGQKQRRSESEESEEDSEYEGALDKLNSFVDGLESKKRKADEGMDGEGKKKKRIVLKERTEAFPEGEFVAVSAADGTASSKVNLEDLLSSFAGSKNPKLVALRKTLKPLVAISSTSTVPTSTSSSHLKTAGPLAAPLPARLQDKIEREAGYEKTKEETDKWNETVRRMKGESGIGVEGARHERLTLPLATGAGNVMRDANAAEWSAKFQPTNELETTIQNLLAAGQMQSSDLRKAEKDALAALDPADVAARQAELRQQRDLMFRAERKAKRVAKIKSKAFRRIHRKEKGKEAAANQLCMEDMEEMDRLDGGDRVVEEKARMEIARARERATLKHSTKGGRWSKTVGGIEGLDEERNTAVREMVARGEELRKRIAGVDPNEESADEFENDESEEDDDDADLDQIKNAAFDELASLDRKEAAAVAADGPVKLKGVLNMKFMKDALARDQKRVQNSADDLRRNLEAMDRAGDDDDEMEDEASPLGMSEQVQGNLGRLVFGPGPTSTIQSITVQVPTVAAAIPKPQNTTKLSGPLAIASSSSRLSTRSPLSLGTLSTAGESNPWLAVGEDAAGKVSRKMNKATVGKDSRDSARMATKVDRDRSKLTDAREADADDAHVEIDPTVVLSIAKVKATPQLSVPKSKKGGGAKATAKSTMVEDGVGSSDEEDDQTQIDAQNGKGPAAFKQRDLVARAFAGDNVVADFEAEKRKQVERDAPREEDNTLPGWGTWSGKGVKKARNPKKFITKIAGIDPTLRKDVAFSHVIISEKKDKKAAKYLMKDLPFPYTSAAQHEHKLRTPLGAEWSTSTILRDQTMPRILIKPGVTIRPVDRRD